MNSPVRYRELIATSSARNRSGVESIASTRALCHAVSHSGGESRACVSDPALGRSAATHGAVSCSVELAVLITRRIGVPTTSSPCTRRSAQSRRAQTVIDAVRDGKTPSFADGDSGLSCLRNRVLRNARCSDVLFEEAVARFGRRRVVELQACWVTTPAGDAAKIFRVAAPR